MNVRGFTLVETVVVMALLVLLMSAGQIFSVTYLRTQQLRAAGDTVASELQLAQTEARTQKGDAAHGVKVFTSYVIRFQGSTYATRVVAKDIRTDFTAPVALSGANEVVFARAQITPVSASTVTLSNSPTAIDIVISSYGLVTITERTIGR